MYGLEFQVSSGTTDAAPNRADVVCFIGFVARRRRPGDGALTALTPEQKRWLADQGWRADAALIPDDDDLLHTPVPVESFEEFARLFAWETRDPATTSPTRVTWLGAAVRSFFVQGGSRCLIVRAGDPWVYAAPRPNRSAAEIAAAESIRNERLKKLVPHFGGGAMPRADDSVSWIYPDALRKPQWEGVGVLHAAAEAAVICLPDLPELVADTTLEPEGFPNPPAAPEVFVECAEPVVPLDPARLWPDPAPACTAAGFDTWFAVMRDLAAFLEANRGRIHADALLAVPLAAAKTVRPGRLLEFLAPANPKSGLSARFDASGGSAARTVQLAYPWLVTANAPRLPGQIEPPDGVLAGVLARSVATRGAHRSLGRQEVREVTGFKPTLEPEEIAWSGPATDEDALIDRVSLLGPSPAGSRVLSDVTSSLIEDERPAGVERLTLAILRAASRLGENLVFESNGPRLWQRVTHALESMMRGFYTLGAFRGDSEAAAFSVVCNHTTTTQSDLDTGRVIARVSFAPAQPVTWITVVLSLREGGQVAVATT